MNTTPVTRWLLEKSPGIVRKLERMASNIVLLGDSEKLGIKNVKLLVPQGIEVYNVISKCRYNGEIFFTLKGEQDMSQAYASVISTKDTKRRLNYMPNTGKLLEYTWFSLQETSHLFNRIARLHGNAPMWNVTPTEGKHPLLK